jgi:hypothetical protein
VKFARSGNTYVFPDLPDERVEGVVHPHPRLGRRLDERNAEHLGRLLGLHHVDVPGVDFTNQFLTQFTKRTFAIFKIKK